MYDNIKGDFVIKYVIIRTTPTWGSKGSNGYISFGTAEFLDSDACHLWNTYCKGKKKK
jgi:hypothetical protein